MKSLLFAFALLAAGPAMSQDRPRRLVADIVYEAHGGGPSWQLVIGDRIALRLGHDNFPDEDSLVVIQYFPRVPSHTTDGIRRWESRTPGGAAIIIEARQAPCTLGDTQFRDTVTVTQGDRRLSGCGGRRLSGGARP